MATESSATGRPVIFPRDMGKDGQAILEQFGFRFSDSVPGTCQYVYATLPEGWQMLVTDNGRYVIDAQGRYRVSVHQRTDLWESSVVSAAVLRRLSIENDASFERRHIGTRVIVTDGDTVFYASAPILVADRRSAAYNQAEKQAFQAANDWCDTHHPEWRNPAAYWD